MKQHYHIKHGLMLHCLADWKLLCWALGANVLVWIRMHSNAHVGGILESPQCVAAIQGRGAREHCSLSIEVKRCDRAVYML